jgi:hypothetical protein
MLRTVRRTAATLLLSFLFAAAGSDLLLPAVAGVGAVALLTGGLLLRRRPTAR